MARAFCSYEFDNVSAGSGDTFILPMLIVFAGTDLPADIKIDRQRVDVTVTFTDTWNTIESAFVDAVMTRATALGYTVARTGVLLIQMGKGS